MFGGSGDVEDIPRPDASVAVIDFLRDDFRHGFEKRRPSVDIADDEGRIRPGLGDDEVNLAAIERNLQIAAAVTAIPRRSGFECEVVLGGIQIWQELRITPKDIDIPTFAVIDLYHHGGATAEGSIIDDLAIGVHLIDQAAGYPEQSPPINGIRPLAHAASG